MKKDRKALIALAGQPNCGKSTVFNALTGANRHVANWPGVTVDKVVGGFSLKGRAVEIVDLPGTYSLTSFSPEERVTRDFLFSEDFSLVVNVLDAGSMRQGLILTLQLLEMGIRPLLNLNMMDVAKRQGLEIDVSALETLLQVPVVSTSMKRRRDVKKLQAAIFDRLDSAVSLRDFTIHYGAMEIFIREIERRLAGNPALESRYPLRWFAVELMKGDQGVEDLSGKMSVHDAGLREFLRQKRKAFEAETGETPELHVAQTRNEVADGMAKYCVKEPGAARTSLSDRIDRFVCNRFAGPLVLLAVMYLLYYLSIVQGYKLTAYSWPILAKFRSLVADVTPAPGFIEIPLARAFALWFTDSINALLNYIPIFFILFALIAILEDSGYMPRMAFIMDRVLRRFGLHGQSVLPMVLGGVYVGGCAVPAVMSCKGIPDERSRMATMLTVPLLNCQAKVPLYILFVNACFTHDKGFAMFFISTVSLLVVLPVAKLLTLTVLKEKETAPFVMEMPSYHLPALRGVLGKTLDRVWLYLKKITTVVAAVSVIIFVLLRFPGLDDERKAVYEREKVRIQETFATAAAGTPFYGRDVMPLLLYWKDYKEARMSVDDKNGAASVEKRFRARNPEFYSIARPGGDPAARRVNRALRKLDRERGGLLANMRRESLENSLLGRAGKVLEPFTAAAGFDWRVNVALLSALAAKENSVSTLGAIYQQGDDGASPESRIADAGSGFTPLHALALMLFMVLYPPCIATAVAVKVQAGSIKWMLFSLAYPILLGFSAAVLVFSGGRALNLSAVQVMGAFWIAGLCVTIIVGFLRHAPSDGGNAGKIPERREDFVPGET